MDENRDRKRHDVEDAGILIGKAAPDILIGHHQAGDAAGIRHKGDKQGKYDADDPQNKRSCPLLEVGRLRVGGLTRRLRIGRLTRHPGIGLLRGIVWVRRAPRSLRVGRLARRVRIRWLARRLHIRLLRGSLWVGRLHRGLGIRRLQRVLGRGRLEWRRWHRTGRRGNRRLGRCRLGSLLGICS